ncbi:hypothetical protein LTR08_005881 [Meristemomyces frigidus]|nr:hypothetical protein LTR08_005881 [Meristemomyces frigidus]
MRRAEASSMHELALKKSFNSSTAFNLAPVTYTSTQASYAPAYFEDDEASWRDTAQHQKPPLIRNHTAPMSAPNRSRTPGPEAPQETLHGRRTLDKDAHGSRPSTAGEGSGHRRTRTREGRERDKKATLSKALQKANTAVVLDNAQNFEGALEAYSDACRLLQHVMDRSSTADDKRKLESIRVTYTNRIEELHQLETNRPDMADDKRLPARPMSDGSDILSPMVGSVSLVSATVRHSATIETATMQRIVDIPRLSYPKQNRDSSFPRTQEAVDGSRTVREPERELETPEPVTPPVAEMPMVDEEEDDGEEQENHEPPTVTHSLTIPQSTESKYMPAPLSPRKPLSPMLQPQAEEAWQQAKEYPEVTQELVNQDREYSNDPSVSWLDTIDESGSDCASSVHSVSNGGLRRKHIRGMSGETDPDFDVAFDAAVEAAYDEGFEPDVEARKKTNTVHEHAHKGSMVVPPNDIREVLSPTNDYNPATTLGAQMTDEEEERLLDEITSDYAQGFDFDVSSKSALPRQSDSSGYTRSTWQSSQVSGERHTAASSLSTVAEDDLASPALQKATETRSSVRLEHTPPSAPPSAPPMTALPRPPNTGSDPVSGVRSRRLSGQPNPKQLKIETAAKPDGRKRASTFHVSPSAKHELDEQKEAFDRDFKFGATLEPTPSDVQHDQILNSPPKLDMRAAPDFSQPQTAAVATINRLSIDEPPGELRSVRPNLFRKNKSSVSLRERTVLISSPDDSAPSLGTPMSSTFLSFTTKRSQDPLTAQRVKIASHDTGSASSLPSGGAYLFDTSLFTMQPPTSPRSPTSNMQPAGLEPCPESFLLRPFWLSRAIASTLTHPKGGFLTTRLFVPREVWLTRGVKLKAVEDKVASCDLLTAALGRLAGVDTFDADAVMDELQSFEEVMERVQAALSKKLGSDVGLQGVSALFKDAPNGGVSGGSSTQGADAGAGAERTSKGKESKGYLHSWRKLRSKSSGTPLAAAQQAGRVIEKELPTMASVPMTSFVPVERRGTRKDIRNLTFEGPQKEYMGSLARLFDGVQVLDQIARQVEDPGLKHSSPTHVGLELSIRHAAEFFGFYICRFVLADLGILLDKFVKRGTEWVLA